MPDGNGELVAVVVGLGVALVLAALWSAFLFGVRRGRELQRDLTSRLGLPSPGHHPPLLFDPTAITTDQGRRDLSGVCSDCGAAQKTVSTCKEPVSCSSAPAGAS